VKHLAKVQCLYRSGLDYLGRGLIALGRILQSSGGEPANRRVILSQTDTPNFMFDDRFFTAKFYYECLRKEIEREDGITHQRLTWLMTFQGFLIAAVALLLASSWPLPDQHSGIVLLRRLAIGAVGITGFILAAVSASGIQASRDALDNVIRDWEHVNKHLLIVPQRAPRTFGEGISYTWGNGFAK
jgi:hypothetical protein